MKINFTATQIRFMCVLVTFLGIFFVGSCAYLYYPKPKASHQAKQIQTDTTISAIASSLSTYLTKEFSYLNKVAAPSQINIGYQLPGYAFQVILPVSSNTLAWTDKRTDNENATYDDFNAVLPQVTEYLSQQGFTKQADNSEYDTFLSAIYFYQRQDAICQVNVYTSLEINCASTDQLESIAHQADPLINLYMKAVSGEGINSINSHTIRASQTAGYTIETLPIFNEIGETNVNFYKQDNGAWQLVNLNWYNDPHEDGEPIPNCAYFESLPAVSQAFYGETCFDSALRTESIIH